MKVNPQKVLWPTDLSELSLRGGRVAVAISQTFGSELHVLHVVPPPLTPDVSVVVPAEVPLSVSEPELREASEEALGRLISEHLEPYDKLVQVVEFGNPWPTICKYAEEHEIDLLVTATHGRTGLSRVLIGSTAERIVEHAPCAVLTIRQSARDFVQ